MPIQYKFTHTDEIIQFVSEHKPTSKDKNHFLLFKYIQGRQKMGKMVEIKPLELERLISFNSLQKMA